MLLGNFVEIMCDRAKLGMYLNGGDGDVDDDDGGDGDGHIWIPFKKN